MSVYIVHAEQTSRYKVGWTVNPMKDRLRTLQTGCPMKLKLIYQWDDALHGDEALLHEVMRPFNVRGEWFELPLFFLSWMDSDDRSLVDLRHFCVVTLLMQENWNNRPTDNPFTQEVKKQIRGYLDD